MAAHRQKDVFDILEEESARRLLWRELGPWNDDVQPLLVQLSRHADPEVKKVAAALRRHVARLMTGK